MFLLIAFILFFNQASDKIEIKDAWMRPAAKEMNSALYFRIINNSDEPDTLFKISSDIAGEVQMHETFKKGDDMMGMREVKSAIVKPNSSFEFKPMGYHVMLINLKKDMTRGNQAEAIFYFRNAGKIKINIPVK